MILAATILTACLAVAQTEPAPPGPTHAGFRIRVADELATETELRDRVLETLRADLDTVSAVLPEPALGLLRERVTVWVERQGAVVPGGMSGRGMVFHPSAIWLKANGLDPARAGGIEIVNARDYLDWRDHQPSMVLHELAHAYHHLIGIDHPDIIGAFESARDAGLYDAVAYALDPGGEGRRAYAMQNPTEYFAELSEAYFGRNDYEPFDRAGLLGFDERGYRVIETLWNLDAEALAKLVSPVAEGD